MKKFLSSTILVFAVVWAGFAQTANREPSATEQLDAVLLKQAEKDTPGVAVMIIKNGEVKYMNTRGITDLSTKAPLRPDSRFYIASLGKQFTAVAVMMLAERGKLSYDDKLVKYFPEFASFAPNITIRQILTHTSGLIDHLDVVKDNVTGWTNDDVVKLLARENRVLFQPGEKFGYSNSGYVLLSLVVEKVSGLEFSKYLEMNIFKPLKMKNTFVVARDAKIENRVRGYIQNNGKWEPADIDAFTTGAGGIFSTLEDLEKWDRSFYTERLIKAETLKLASVPAVLNNGRPTPYGFGWLAEFAAKGKLANVWYVASFGDFKGFKGLIKRIPEKRFTVIVLTNNGNFPWQLVELAHDLYAA
jgi:CubicO group peptidase (beta-lactamase class C family)